MARCLVHDHAQSSEFGNASKGTPDMESGFGTLLAQTPCTFNVKLFPNLAHAGDT
jgi:hypothetical protein